MVPAVKPSAAERILAIPVSARFAAILDFALDAPVPRVSPQITALAITSDGFLMAWDTASPFKEGLIGEADDLERNLKGICAHGHLTAEETREVRAAVFSKIKDWRTH